MGIDVFFLLNVNPCQVYGQGLFGDMTVRNVIQFFEAPQTKTGVGRNKKKKRVLFEANKVIVREIIVIYCLSLIILLQSKQVYYSHIIKALKNSF